jgi:biopolymer transport protein ExbB/TolQ
MNDYSYFEAGGPFMTPITIVGLAMVDAALYSLIRAFRPDAATAALRRMNSVVLQLGILAFFLGILSQAMGLMQAFQVIQQVGDVSPALLAGGLYVSLIAPVWGLIILTVGWVLYAVAKYRLGAA